MVANRIKGITIARGSRVQNREIESKNMQTSILHKSCKMRYNIIDIVPEWVIIDL